MAMARANMQAISTELTGHGGRLDAALSIYADAPRPWLDLSTGINPNPWTPREPLAFDLGRLPTRSDLRMLEGAAAGHFGVDPARVAAVPGSEIALRLLPSLGLPRPIRAPIPGYGTYGEIADTDAGEADEAGGTLIRANPNNPDGELLRSINPASDRLVIDEAFADAVEAHSRLPYIDPSAPVIVLRSFGKFFGLAGLRLGFVIATPALLAKLRALLGDWPVSAQAIAYGREAYRDTGWIAGMRADLAARAERLDALLARHGLAATGACPLYRLVASRDAPAIFDRLARAGVLVRPFADRPDWLRFGLPADDPAFARLDRTLGDG
jgi:cobalamin biosynthetic protein CobC